jgi:type I restriction enzyme S subunit
MNHNWNPTKLSDLLKSVVRPVRLDFATTYRLLGAHWYAKGLYVKEEKKGSEIRATSLFKVKEGDFVYNRLFAWKGSFAVATKDVDGCLVSNEFPCFTVRTDLAHPKYLWLYFSREISWNEALGLSTGSTPTSRNRLKEPQFLDMEIQLPPLDEQCRIVFRMEELGGRLHEARQLRQESHEASSRFITSLHLHLSGPRMIPLRDVLRLDERRISVSADGKYPQVGIRGFGGGLFGRGALEGTQTTYKEFNLLFDGALVLSQVKGWEGAVAVCGKAFAGWYASPEYRTFSFIPDQAIPEYMSAIVTTSWFYGKLADLTRGVGARRERTRPEAFLEIVIPMPTVEQQRDALRVFDKLELLKLLQTETALELDALAPSILAKAFSGEL